MNYYDWTIFGDDWGEVLEEYVWKVIRTTDEQWEIEIIEIIEK